MSSYLSPNSERDLRRPAVGGAGAGEYSPGDVLLVMAAHGLPQPLGERHPVIPGSVVLGSSIAMSALLKATELVSEAASPGT